MKTMNKILSRVLTAMVFMAMCLTFNMVLTGCDEAALNTTKSGGDEPVVPPTQDKTDYKFININDNVDIVNTQDSTGINGQWWPCPGEFRLEVRDNPVKLFGVDLENLSEAVAYGNNNASAMKTTSISEGKNLVNTSTRSFPMVNDRNLATVIASVRQDAHFVDGEYKMGGYLVVDNIILTKLQVEGKAATRSAEWILTKAFDVEVGAQVILHEENVNYRAAKSGLVVNLYKKFRVERYDTLGIKTIEEKSSIRKATTYTDEFGEKVFVVTYNDGSTVEMKKYVPMTYEIKPTKLDRMDVDNFNFSISNSINKIEWKEGEREVKKTENYIIYEREGSYSSSFANGVNTFNTLYTAKSQRCEYNDGLVKFEFGYEDIKVVEGNSTVNTTQSDRDGYSKGIFVNNITGTYLGLAQPVQEEKELYMKKKDEDKIISSDWDESSKNKWYKADSVICEADWIIKHTVEPTEIFHYRMSFPRILKPLTGWRATVEQFLQSTAAAGKPNVNNSKGSQSSKDGKVTWSYTRSEGESDAITRADKAQEENRIYFLEYNSISATREGKPLYFGTDDWSISHDGGKLGAEKSVSDGTEVPFTLTWSYKFGSDSQTITTPGTLFKKSVPEEEDKVVSADFENPDETMTHTGYTPTIDWREKHSKEADKVTPLSCPFGRSASCVSNWSATVSRFHQNTASYSAKLVSSKHQSKLEGDFKWEWDDEVYRVEAKTSLTGADAQMNVVESSEVNNVKVTHVPSGKSYSWSKKSVAAPHDNGHLTKVSDKEYSYTLIMRYTFGGDVQEISCPGTLKMN